MTQACDVLYSVRDYRGFLDHKLEVQGGARGYRAQLAAAAGCQRSYLSQILSGHLELTLDQAAGLAQFWGLDDEATEYWLMLVQRARAGTPTLRKALDRSLATMRARQRDLAERFGGARIDADAAQQLYYSSWHFAAIHILLAIPAMSTAAAIAERLDLTTAVVESALARLAEIGVIERSRKGGWTVKAWDVHLPRNAPMTQANHLAWRQRAAQDVQRQRGSSFHFTSVFAMRRADAERLQQMIADHLAGARELIKESESEEIYAYTLDLFPV